MGLAERENRRRNPGSNIMRIKEVSREKEEREDHIWGRSQIATSQTWRQKESKIYRNKCRKPQAKCR